MWDYRRKKAHTSTERRHQGIKEIPPADQKVSTTKKKKITPTVTKEKITSRTIFFLLKCSLIFFWVHPSLLCFSLNQTDISSCAEYAVWMNVERHMVCGTPHQQECTSEPSSFLPCLSLTSDQSNVKMFHRCFVHPSV